MIMEVKGSGAEFYFADRKTEKYRYKLLAYDFHFRIEWTYIFGLLSI